MADRISGVVVVLEDDARDTDLGPLIAAIAQLRGVLDVKPITSRPGLEFVLKQRIKAELRERLLAALAGGEDAEY
jgi:hypothetical protein